jgi:hypothetical protein
VSFFFPQETVARGGQFEFKDFKVVALDGF